MYYGGRKGARVDLESAHDAEPLGDQLRFPQHLRHHLVSAMSAIVSAISPIVSATSAIVSAMSAIVSAMSA